MSPPRSVTEAIDSDRSPKRGGRAGYPRSHKDAPRRKDRRRRRTQDGDKRSLLYTRVVDEAPRRRRRPDPRTRRGGARQRTTLLFSCHGGTGSTTLATTMGAILAQASQRTCVLDLDLQFGDALTSLNLRSSCPISNLMSDEFFDGKRIDRTSLYDRLPRHATGLFVLSQAGCVEGLADVTHETLAQLLRPLRRCFDVLLVDGVRDFSDLALIALDAVDSVVLITNQDVPSLRGLVMRLEIFKRLGYDLRDVHIVINRYSRKNPVPLEAIADSLEVQPNFVVAENFKVVHRALDEGRSLIETAPGADVTQDVARMTDELYGLRPAKGRGLLGRLLGARG